jgi:inactivated superfamily I helicase/RecB family exonuclease
MKIVTLPYGRAGWDARVRLVEEVLSSRPGTPCIYNDVLILVPSSRMKRVYGRLFLDTVERLQGSAALVQPEVQTLPQFFQRLYATLGGPLLVDEISRLVLLEGIVKERIAGKPGFGKHPDVLAPSLSAAVADMIEQLSMAGVAAERLAAAVAGSEFPDKPQVRLLVDAYGQYERMLGEKGLMDPGGTLNALREQFDPAWLASYSLIIVDGVHDADVIQARLLEKIAEQGNCTFLVEAPATDILRSAGENHPLRLAREFVAGLGPVLETVPAAISPEDRFLSDTLFSDETFAGTREHAPLPPSFKRDIRLLSAVNTREEVSLIAGEVKRSLQQGAIAESLLVTFPALDEYGPLIEELFTDYGISYNCALGRQLSTSSVTTAVMSLLRACQEEFSGPSLIRVLSSPLLKFGEHASAAAALDRLLRDRRITGGKYKLLAALKQHARGEREKDILTEPLTDLFGALEPFTAREAAPLSLWMERLANLVSWSGLAARVASIRGPLNINLQAFRKMNDTLASLGRAGRLFPGYRYTFSEWFFLLRKTFMHARFQVPPEDEGGVQVLGLGESIGRAWSEIYLGGLIEGKFPQRLPQNIFLPEATLETLGVRTLERARTNAAHHFYRLLLSAEKVTLTFPENEGDRPVAPSPFLEELTLLRKAGLINRGIERTTGIQFSLKIEDSRSIPELAKAISLSGTGDGLSQLLNADIEGLSGIRSAIIYRPVGPVPAAMPPAKREFSVTELDVYLNCPYDYYVTKVLGIRPLEEVTEDVTPLSRGSKVHAILRNFYLSWKKTVTREHREEARALLRKLADSAFDQEADTFRNRREKELFLTVMAERFLDAEEEFWKQGMQPVYLEQKVEKYRLALSQGGDVWLSAKIDRIDRDVEGNFIIVDYKTGKYPLPKKTAEQDIFQLPVYAVMAQAALHGVGPGLGKPIGLAYYDLAGKTGAGARDVVLFDKDARDDHPSSKPRASSKSAEEFGTILKQSMDKARKAIEGILAGEFTSTPQDENKCRYCPNEMMCEKSETNNS